MLTTIKGVNDPRTKEVLAESLILSEYFQYIGMDHAVLLGHLKDDFIVSCTYNIRYGSLHTTVPCDNDTIKLQVSSRHLNCYSVSLDGNILPKLNYTNAIPSITGVSFILYLDNFETSLLKPLGTLERNGFQVMTGHRGSTAVSRNYFYLMPGLRYSILPSTTYRKRLTPPHGECSMNTDTYKIWSFTGERLPFSTETCALSLLQNKIFGSCGCIYSHYFVLPNTDLPMTDIPSCLSLKMGVDVYMNRSNCMKQILMDDNLRSFNECPELCEEVFVSNSISHTKWPPLSIQLNFYQHVIKPGPHAPKFLIYEDILKQVNSGNHTLAETMLKQTTLIEDNFVLLEYDSLSTKFLITENVAQVTIHDLLSQLGGVLNLYAGISMVLTVELIDLILSCLYHWFDNTGEVKFSSEGNAIALRKKKLQNKTEP